MIDIDRADIYLLSGLLTLGACINYTAPEYFGWYTGVLGVLLIIASLTLEVKEILRDNK